jgi:tetratricopeptide (TPR) repeat protein
MLLIISLFYAVVLAGPVRATGPAATIEGVVKDLHGAPVAGASVSLTMERGVSMQTASTNAQGIFRFPALAAGSYALRVKMAGYDELSLASFSLEPGEEKSITLTLKMAPPPAQGSKPTAIPEFSDEPNFTVAGVTDTSNLGGHGSDVTVRNRESLARATASLGGQSPAPAKAPPSRATEKSFREAVHLDSASFDANFRLGKLLVEEGKSRQAIPYLERASQTKAGVYENEYELALAHCEAGDFAIAGKQARALLARKDTSELHHLLAEAEEKRGDPLEAVRQYQRAAELDPNESNYFDWGAELLLHQAEEPAVEVFSKGSRLFPNSVRMLSALGAAWYGSGSNERAVETLCRASDLDPSATEPYIFLGRIQNAETAWNAGIADRLARFVQLQPANALANYYYAVSLWKQRKGPDDNGNLPLIESSLLKAVSIDPTLAAAHLQLGALYFERKDFPAAIAAYRKAAETAPDLPDAHYRLAQAYRQVGEKTQAQQELQLYKQTSKKAAEEVDREHHEIRQFIYTLRNPAADSRTQ